MRRLVMPLACLLLLASTPATALPAFAAREGEACGFCHLSPAGGGPRNAAGQRYEANGFTFGAPEAPESSQDIETVPAHESVWDRVAVSGTMVMAYTATQGAGDDGGSCASCHSAARVPDNRFMLMSGQLRVAARVTDRLSVVASTDLGQPRELYAAYALVPQRVHARAGLFVVPFGLKNRDHTSFVDAKFNVGSNRRDIGIAAGGVLGPTFWEAALTGGGTLSPISPPARVFRGADPTVAATVGANLSGLRTGASFMQGQSAFVDRYGTPDAAFRPLENPEGYLQRRYAFFALYSRDILTATVEIIYGTDQETRTPGVGDPREAFPRLASMASVAVSPLNWVSVGGRYEFFDPSREHRDDALTHYVAFAEFTAGRHVTLHARYRMRRESDVVEIDNDDLVLILRVDT